MISRFIYRYIFKRTSSFVLSIVIASVFFERAYDHACENIFEWINKGRLWTHIKHKYENTSKMIHQHDVKKNTSNLEKASNKDKDAKKD
ncbi:Cytochrome b-c1 complex subunit [Apis cerana cerana]|uniref:Cytochrome b-c1 complex subunit 9 n=1 Tax=Apis cerana cerana TaxID=94128 RepID=A0A2A3EQ24_APICC|nr:Cytochrome b-c1 complex subunit [Apis cerana cerana]